jgi:tetratricopeptide (TPR) repeat protein
MFSVHCRALALAGLLFLPVNTVSAQSSGEVRGVVVDELGRPISQATVAVSSFGATKSETTQTTSDGHYTYGEMTAGLYTITATKNELSGEVFRIRVRDSHTVSVNFELTPGRRVASYLVEASEREALSRTFAAGIQASRAGDFDLASDAFRSTLDLSPTCLECHYNLAIAYAALDQFADAEAEFQSVLRLKEDYAAAYYGLSSIYTRQGRPTEAAEARSEASRLTLARVNMSRAQAEDAVARGVTFFNAGNVTDAIGRFEAAVELDVTLPAAYYWLGRALQESGRDVPARSALQRYLQLASSGEFAAEARQRRDDLAP